jgi:hypothetical protein
MIPRRRQDVFSRFTCGTPSKASAQRSTTFYRKNVLIRKRSSPIEDTPSARKLQRDVLFFIGTIESVIGAPVALYPIVPIRRFWLFLSSQIVHGQKEPFSYQLPMTPQRPLLQSLTRIRKTEINLASQVLKARQFRSTEFVEREAIGRQSAQPQSSPTSHSYEENRSHN